MLVLRLSLIWMKDSERHFRGFLRQRGLKLTRGRKDVLRAVVGRMGHFDVESLVYDLRRQGSRVSRGTVYRSIPLLVEAAILRPVAFTDRHAHYENVLSTRHHEHLICLRCGTIIEFERKPLEQELEKVCRGKRFLPLAHKVEVTGYCAQCAKQQAESMGHRA